MDEVMFKIRREQREGEKEQNEKNVVNLSKM